MTLTDLPWNHIAAALVVLGATFVQSSIGFGFAIVSAPLLFYIDPLYVPVPIMLGTIINSAFNLFYFRGHLSVSHLVPALVWRVPGSIAGAALLWWMNPQWLALFIAALITIGIVASYLKLPIAFNRRNLALAGFFSGVSGTATSIGGPPVAILMQGQAPNTIRSQMAAFFLFSSIVSLIVLGLTGFIRAQQWLLSWPLIPTALLGSWLGVTYGARLQAEPMRKATLVVCVIAVVVMLSSYL